jgi:hypothetical protein
MRNVGLALALCVAAAACTALLDTASLQRGAGGAGGQGGEADAGSDGAADARDAAAKSCTSDADCLPGLEVDGCTVYACGPPDDRTCRAPQPNSGGLGIVSAGSVETIMTADDIGYPSLLSDGSDIVMAVWHRTGSASDILVRKYGAYPQTGAGAELSAIAPGMFRAYGSSPGLMVRPGIPRRVRLLLAADRIADAGSGMAMRLLDIDVPALNNNLKLSAMQPTPTDLGIAGYDRSPRSFPPRLFINGPFDPAGMWIQQNKLYYFDGMGAREAYSGKRVIGFSPLFGATGVHAALETATVDADGGTGPSRTELWSDGSAALVSLDGDQPGIRRGLTSTYASESNANINLIAWSFEPKTNLPALFYRAAFCGGIMGMSCTSYALMNQPDTIPAVLPELTSVEVNSTDRDVLQTFEVIFADTTELNVANSALFASVARFSLPSSDLTKGSSKTMNPPLFFVDLQQGPLGAQPGDVLGPSSVAITQNGQLLVAWVVRPSNSGAVLRARRYLVKTCP